MIYFDRILWYTAVSRKNEIEDSRIKLVGSQQLRQVDRV